MALDEVDRAAKLNAAVKLDGIGHRPRVSAALPISPVRQSERQFEMPWDETGVVLARSAAAIRADRRGSQLTPFSHTRSMAGASSSS